MGRLSLAAVAVSALMMASPAPAKPPRFYVSPAGRDTGPGTRVHPFRTLVRAQRAVRTVNSPLAYVPKDVTFVDNTIITGRSGVPRSILAGAGPRRAH